MMRMNLLYKVNEEKVVYSCLLQSEILSTRKRKWESVKASSNGKEKEREITLATTVRAIG